MTASPDYSDGSCKVTKIGDQNVLFGANVDAYSFFGIGEKAGVYYLWTLYAVAADTWTDPVLIERTDAGTAFATAWPSLTYVDLYRALFTGYLVGEEYSRVLRMRGIYAPTYSEAVWTDPFPFKAKGGPFGMVIGYEPGGDGYVCAACSNAAYRAKAAGESSVDVSSRLVKYKAVDRWTGHKVGRTVRCEPGQGERLDGDLLGGVWSDTRLTKGAETR